MHQRQPLRPIGDVLLQFVLCRGHEPPGFVAHDEVGRLTPQQIQPLLLGLRDRVRLPEVRREHADELTVTIHQGRGLNRANTRGRQDVQR